MSHGDRGLDKARTTKGGAINRQGRNQHSHALGPYSTSDSLIKIDKRSRGYLYVKGLRAQLVDHLGHPPNNVEAMLIDRCCWLSLRLLYLDRKIAANEDFNLPDANYYLAWSNSLCRTLARLGVKDQPKRKGHLTTVMTEIGYEDAAE